MHMINVGHAAIKRWTKKIDIFSFDLILIPVHLGMHWCLATIDLKRKGVFYYDSMGGDNEPCLHALIKYLQVTNQFIKFIDEYKVSKGKETAALICYLYFKG